MCSSVNKYHGVLCVIGGFIIQCTYGYFYTIGNMAPYILDYLTHHNKSVYDNSIMWMTSIALGMEALAMPIGGVLYSKVGIRTVVIISSLVHRYSSHFSGGITLSYYTLSLGFIPLLMTYGVLQGFGFGFGYSAVMAASFTWFQNHRGLIVGLIVGGFGAGSIIFTPIQTVYINPNNIKIDNNTKRFEDIDLLNRVPSVFLLIGGVLLVLQLIGIVLVRDKPKLFGKIFINDDRFLAILGVISSAFNAAGRVFWGTIGDRVSFKIPLCIIFLCWSLLLTSLPHLPVIFGTQIKVGFGVWLCGLYLLISGVLVYTPTATETLFGPINMAVNYGLVFNAFFVPTFHQRKSKSNINEALKEGIHENNANSQLNFEWLHLPVLIDFIGK
ncbi:Oxalate:formate antiporter [Schistosoma japonicum]|nr:Oxalate:formate antiporter [Schistosoma japonicum]